MHSADLLAEVQRALIDRSGIDPMEVGQVVGGCVGSGGHAGGQRHPHRVAPGRAPARGGGHHRQHPVRLVAAGHQHRHRAGRRRSRRRRGRVRRRGDERRPDGIDGAEGPLRRQADQQALLGALREHVAVRGRGAHRRDLRRHPRRARRLRQAVAGPRRRGVGGRPLRHSARADRGADARRARRGQRHAHRGARRRTARHHARGAGQPEAGARPRPGVPHRRHRVADQRRRRRAPA